MEPLAMRKPALRPTPAPATRIGGHRAGTQSGYHNAHSM